jgi:uncharacterized protein YlxW (UPF0749 family)
MEINCCILALIAFLGNIIQLIFFFNYSLKLKDKSVKLEKSKEQQNYRIKELEKKNGKEQHQIVELKKQVEKLEQKLIKYETKP